MSKILKNFIENISSALGLTGSALEELIKETKKYLEAEVNLADKHDDAIESLRKYSDVEDPSLSEALETLATAYKEIEAARKEKVEKLEVMFIEPLQHLLEELKFKKTEMKEAEKAKDELEKAQKKFNKEQNKPEEKKDIEKLEHAEKNLEDAEKKYEVEDAEAQSAIATFKGKRIAILKEVLENISELEKDFYQKAVELTISVKVKADEIETNEEENKEERKEESKEKSKEE